MYVCMYVCIYIYIYAKKDKTIKNILFPLRFLRATLDLVLSTLHPFVSGAGAVMANRHLLASFRTEYFS